MTPGCVYCPGSGILEPSQILMRGDHLYVCAPRGQLVPGFVAIAPLECIGSCSQLPGDWFVELDRMSAAVAQFYAQAYGNDGCIRYEQGRAGGGARVDPADGFPLHAHLCSLPLDVDLHGWLGARYEAVAVDGPAGLAGATHGQPYVYVEQGGGAAVYVGRSPRDVTELASFRLRPVIAGLLGRPERGYWRDDPDDPRLEEVIETWRNVFTTSPSPS
jgi:diadenosine tetraphosphate (Ap4A) HIT family hydrolase